MNKKEFLNELKFALRKSNDKDDIVNYYDELISDKIEEGNDEVEVINSLGSIEDILTKLNIEYTTNKTLISKIRKGLENKESKVIIIILLILSSPIWIGFVIGLIGVLIGIVGGFIGILAGICFLPIAGFVGIIKGFVEIQADFNYALFIFGVSLSIIGISFIIIPITYKLVKILIEYSIKLSKKLSEIIKREFEL